MMAFIIGYANVNVVISKQLEEIILNQAIQLVVVVRFLKEKNL